MAAKRKTKRKTFPGMVRGAADPSAAGRDRSAALGMTKQRAMHPINAVLSGRRFQDRTVCVRTEKKPLVTGSHPWCRTIGFQLLKGTIVATLLVVTCELINYREASSRVI
jgi:hypothetical protein